MFYLIKLEMKRMNLYAIFRTVLILNIFILGLVLLIYSDSNEFKSYTEVFNIIKVLVGIVFIVYASVLLAKIFVQEFRDKTISILFMYPVNRKKLLMAKVIIVSTLTFSFVVLSNIVLSGGVLLLSKVLPFMEILNPLTAETVVNTVINLIVFAIACTGLGLIPLFFGMIKRSVPITIVSSMFVIMLLNTDGSGQLSIGIVFQVLFGIIGFLIAYQTIRKATRVDL